MSIRKKHFCARAGSRNRRAVDEIRQLQCEDRLMGCTCGRARPLRAILARLVASGRAEAQSGDSKSHEEVRRVRALVRQSSEGQARRTAEMHGTV